jgi:hypothetical protein
LISTGFPHERERAQLRPFRVVDGDVGHLAALVAAVDLALAAVIGRGWSLRGWGWSRRALLLRRRAWLFIAPRKGQQAGECQDKRQAKRDERQFGLQPDVGRALCRRSVSIMREINASIPFDKALWRQDIAASKAHVAMLEKQGIVSMVDAAAISGGLDQVAANTKPTGCRKTGISKTST